MTYLLAIFAIFRVARMIAREDGPFDVFSWIQAQAEPKQEQSWIARGVLCPLCLGFWIALPAALLIPHKSKREFILNWLGLAGGAAALYLLTEK